MIKRMTGMLLILGLLFGGIFTYKYIGKLMMKKAIAQQTRLISVSTLKVGLSDWNHELAASGSLRAIKGVNVTTELAGMVQTISFDPGAQVEENQILVQLNADNDLAELHALEANAELAKTTYSRDKAQYDIHAVSKQTLDNDEANLKSLLAQVAQQAAIVQKKTIKAPFSGRLGINHVNPGQFLNPGDNVVTLQTLDPIYVDFYLPQQHLNQLQVGQRIKLTSDAYPGDIFWGKISTIEPAVNVSTRNVEVEATLENPENKLMPGMFGHVDILVGEPSPFITIPQSAISFNPYGSIVYIIRNQKEKNQLIANQRFIKTGETRGEQVQVLQGLEADDEIVTSGQLKLKNGSVIVVNNAISPSNSPDPLLNNDHEGPFNEVH